MSNTKKGSMLIEMLIFVAVSSVVIVVMLVGFKSVLFNLSLDNEVIFLKKVLDYAQDYAYTNQKQVDFVIEGNGAKYYIKAEDKELKKRDLPKRIKLSGQPVSFTKNITPSNGTTLTLTLDKKEKKVIIDPSNGRIRIP